MTLLLCNMFPVGLLQGKCYICGMMTIMMMMVLIGLLGVMMKINFFGWYYGYKKWKVQKAKIYAELLSIAWHPNCVMDWCMLEDQKR